MLKNLFIEIEKNHSFEFSDNLLEIEEFEKKCGYKLPEDLKEFYKRYKTVSLFAYNGGWRYRFVEINEIHMAGLDIFGEAYAQDKDFSIEVTYSWFSICDVMDGNYIGIDFLSEKNGQWNFIDCFHETYGIPGECTIIAKSFTELLEKCLQSNNKLYYLEKGFQDYGDALEITPETAIRRIDPIKPRFGWLGEIIRRIRNPHIQPGWLVQFVKQNESHLKFFEDKEFGSKEKSFEKAKSYVVKNKKLGD